METRYQTNMSTTSNLSLVTKQSNCQVLSQGPDDLFVEVAKDIYQNQGYEKLKTFYLDATGFKHELNVSLLPYYYSLQLEDEESQNNLLSEILIKVMNFQQSFNLDIRNPHLRRKVTEYFQISKKNINGLDPQKNGDFCISKIQLDWEVHTRNLDVYYNYIVSKQSEAIDARMKKKGFIENIRYYLGYSSTNQSNLGLEGSSTEVQSHLPRAVENPHFDESYSNTAELEQPEDTTDAEESTVKEEIDEDEYCTVTVEGNKAVYLVPKNTKQHDRPWIPTNQWMLCTANQYGISYPCDISPEYNGIFYI